MEDYLREELVRRNYSFVYTPHIAKRELWQISGHEQNYADSMFAPTTLEETEFRLKPMNCPFHIGIFRSQQRSYRDLPQRYAEMGTVYRAELSGTLHGLMRVRGFTVDDAHLFCTPEQVRQEIDDCVDFAYQVLKTFGFEKIKFELSVKGSDTSKQWFGAEEQWANAEAVLAAALDARQIKYERIEGEAAFYGPKIDFKIEDAIGRLWQLGTVQYDFNLPERFELEYIAEDNKPHRPVMVHRALFGSIERFFGVLIEHYAGAFPCGWRQCRWRCCRLRIASMTTLRRWRPNCAARGCESRQTGAAKRLAPRFATRRCRRCRLCWCWAIAKWKMET